MVLEFSWLSIEMKPSPPPSMAPDALTEMGSDRLGQRVHVARRDHASGG